MVLLLADLNKKVLFLFSPPMRLTILSLFLLVGCTPDALIPCNEDGPAGMLCREYRYFDDAPQGYVEFEYHGDSVVSNIFNRNSILEKTIIERYDDERIISVTNQFPEEESVVASYHYNELDSLFLIVYGTNDSSVQISYLDGKRSRESRVVDDEVVGYKDFRYFQDDGQLYRISLYNGSDSLLNYRNFDYFNTNGIERYRATEFTAEHQLIGRRLYTFSQNGLISSMEFRLEDGTVAERKDYIYDGAGKLIEETGRFYSSSSKSVYLYH
jgi:hypothetical protein